MIWPTTPPAWLLPWAIWRFRYPTPRPSRTDGGPKEIPAWAFGFLVWAGWRRKGATPPRPTSTVKAPIPVTIPKWAWGLLRDLNIAVPLAPPPPPPPPAHPAPPDSWDLPLPLVFFAWGPLTDSDFRNVGVIGRRLQAAHVPTVALRIGMYPDGYPQALRDYVPHVALWNLADTRDQDALDRAEADGYLPQIEGPGQHGAAVQNLEAGVASGLSVATIATTSAFSHFTTRPNGTINGETTTQEAEELVDVGCTRAFIECYDGDMRVFKPAQELYEAKHRGIYYVNPATGLARPDVELDDYSPAIDPYVRQIAVYLAEGMNAAHWAELAAL